MKHPVLINNLIYSSPLPPFQCWLRWARNLHIVLSAIDELLYTFFRIYVQHCAGGRGFCLFYWFFIGVSLTFCQDCRHVLVYSIYTVRQVSAFRWQKKEILRGKVYEENVLVVVSDELHVIPKQLDQIASLQTYWYQAMILNDRRCDDSV